MFWLIVTSYKRNRSKYLYAILSLILTTFLATISVASFDLAASVWKKPFLEYGGGHILIRMSEPEETWSLWHPTSVFDEEKVKIAVQDIFPEATITSLLIVPATYENTTGDSVSRLISVMKEIVGRNGGLDSWYLFPETKSGLPLKSVPVDDDSTVVIVPGYSSSKLGFPDATFRIARYVGTDHPWEFVDADPQILEVAGTHSGAVYPVYMRLEALRAITGCPDNIVSMIGVALPGIQYEVDNNKVEQLRTRLSLVMPQLEVLTVDDVGKQLVSDIKILDDALRKYLPIIYAISFTVVAAIVTSIAQSRRRELHLLHILGLSRLQVRLLFAMECIIATSLAGLIGYLPIVAIGRFALNTGQISVLPLAITLVGAILIAVLRSSFLLNRDTSQAE